MLGGQKIKDNEECSLQFFPVLVGQISEDSEECRRKTRRHNGYQVRLYSRKECPEVG
jgi:hypothetical protein